MDIQANLEFLLQQDQFSGEFPAVTESGAHFYKGPDHEDAHINSPRAVEDIGRHYGAVLGEGIGEVFDVLSAFKVAICDLEG